MIQDATSIAPREDAILFAAGERGGLGERLVQVEGGGSGVRLKADGSSFRYTTECEF